MERKNRTRGAGSKERIKGKCWQKRAKIVESGYHGRKNNEPARSDIEKRDGFTLVYGGGKGATGVEGQDI